jgi:cell division protein FtsA
VITGGGAQLRHIVQLVEYITGMDTRIGYPNEHLAKGSEELKSPLFATAVGLVINGFKDLEKKQRGMAPVQEVIADGRKEKIKVKQPVGEPKSFLTLLSNMFKEEEDNRL